MPSSALHVGQRVDKYVVRGPLAAGSWGRVFEARHERLGSDVAIKVLSNARDGVTERFESEARTAARVRHRNVLEVYDVGNLADGTPYLVMELLRGGDLAAKLDDGPLPIDAVVDLGRQLAAGLVALSDAGVVHRDIKPQNIVLHHEGDEVVAKIVDFGVSKPRPSGSTASASDGGMVVGTPYYMSPEQVRGDDLDARSDMYSVGVVLYECLTGRLPFVAPSVGTLARCILDDPVPPIRDRRAECPRDLEAVVLRMLAKDPAARHASPRELGADLERLVATLRLRSGATAWAAHAAESRPPQALPASGPAVPVPADRTARKWVLLAVVALLALMVATMLGWIGP